ncbi:hypothetical protein [Variovorax sp. 350MFTsu5.1]
MLSPKQMDEAVEAAQADTDRAVREYFRRQQEKEKKNPPSTGGAVVPTK